MQRALENIAFKLRIPQRKPWQQMTEDVVKATTIVNNEAQVGHDPETPIQCRLPPGCTNMLLLMTSYQCIQDAARRMEHGLQSLLCAAELIRLIDE